MEAGQAHHGAFARLHGEDPDWPLWYAHFLAPRLRVILAIDEAQLAHALAQLDAEHRLASTPTPWQEYYAERLLHRFGG